MRFFWRLSMPQRIVIVVALGVACAAVGFTVAGTGSAASFGWYAYAPLTPGGLPRPGLAGWQRLLIWLGLTAGWALASLWVLRPSPGRTAGG